MEFLFLVVLKHSSFLWIFLKHEVKIKTKTNTQSLQMREDT